MPATDAVATANVRMPNLPEREQLPIRRFELPDLAHHGGWLFKRLVQAYPAVNQRNAAAWLNSIIYSAEFLFLYQDHAVGLAQLDRPTALEPSSIIRECFVFAENIENKEHLEQAANCYDEFARWAKHHGASVVVVQVQSDVPEQMIRQRLGRVFTRQQTFARIIPE